MKIKHRGVFYAVVCLLIACLFFVCPWLNKNQNDGGRYALNTFTASASGDLIAIEKYDVNMVVSRDRTIAVTENITVRFLGYGLSMFYRSLPTTGARYKDITATCAGNDEFHYYVASNPDVDGYIDINCEGNADHGKVWTYTLSYIMEQGTNAKKDGMIIDVVGFGWTVPLHNVTATVRLPQNPLSYNVHTDIFGAQTDNQVQYSISNNTVTMTSDCLDMVYSHEYNEYVAGGITLEFALAKGVLKDYTSIRMFTEDMWKIVFAGIVCVALSAVLFIFTRTKREVVTVVHVKPPQDMDPIKMGKWIDGAVNNEDITSMIYYFANKGYLRIDFTNEDDPELISLVERLPDGAPVYQQTLFNGLFQNARVHSSEKIFDEAAPTVYRAAKVSELTGKFFEASQTAIKQVPDATTMYEKKSIFGYFGGIVIGFLLATLVPLFMGMRVGGGYLYFYGAIFAIPLAVNALIGYLCENYRYKWKRGHRLGLLCLELAISLLFIVIFAAFFADFIMTGYEKLVLGVCVCACPLLTRSTLSRTEEYLALLGDILGFKNFIVVTEEDKIKFMLEENPDLYYHVLPYAQVLGVTDEWDGKFKNILIEPPSWYYGTHMDVFDYMLIHRCMNRSMISAMSKMAQQQGGRYVGGSGRGGGFGGFGGGGFGGGGGGAR